VIRRGALRSCRIIDDVGSYIDESSSHDDDSGSYNDFARRQFNHGVGCNDHLSTRHNVHATDYERHARYVCLVVARFATATDSLSFRLDWMFVL
jgi:hypothetical protein